MSSSLIEVSRNRVRKDRVARPRSSSHFPRFPGSPQPGRPQDATSRLLAALLFLVLATIGSPPVSSAQDWGEESDDGWSEPAPRRRPTPRSNGAIPRPIGWSVRAGLGFIDDPNALLLNFEAPYAFDQWVSAGPTLQVGIEDHNTIVAPTAAVTVSIPDLPGDDFDNVHPYALVGIGFAYIEDDNRQNDNSSVGFLINFGVGVEYQVSERFSIGSQMMFNFLPEETLDEDFFYSWQVGGVRIAF